MKNLTERERQVAGLVATGMRTRAVAHELGIACGTVRIHLNNIYAKLGVNNRVLLAMAWLRHAEEIVPAE